MCAAEQQAPLAVPSAAPVSPVPVSTPLPEVAAPVPMCMIAVFKVIELKMNRTKVVHVPLGESIRYNTLIMQPQSCVLQKYAGGHVNTTIYMNIHTLPYRVMTEPDLVNVFPPTLVFSGLMSTISPTFVHANYAVIPVECLVVTCVPKLIA